MTCHLTSLLHLARRALTLGLLTLASAALTPAQAGLTTYDLNFVATRGYGAGGSFTYDDVAKQISGFTVSWIYPFDSGFSFDAGGSQPCGTGDEGLFHLLTQTCAAANVDYAWEEFDNYASVLFFISVYQNGAYAAGADAKSYPGCFPCDTAGGAGTTWLATPRRTTGDPTGTLPEPGSLALLLLALGGLGLAHRITGRPSQPGARA